MDVAIASDVLLDGRGSGSPLSLSLARITGPAAHGKRTDGLSLLPPPRRPKSQDIPAGGQCGKASQALRACTQ